MNHPVRPGTRANAVARVVQSLGILVLRPLVLFLYRARVRHHGPLPLAPFLLACNHRSFLDPPFVGMWMHDPVSYFARASLWRVPGIALLLRIMYGIPVERDNPGLSSMKGAIERLQEGISVLVFPEGTRTRDGRLGRLRDGPALFARRAGVPVVPVYVHNSEAVWPRGALLPRLGEARIEIRFGPPMRAPAHLPTRVQDTWLTTRLRLWMEAQERALRGPAVTRPLRAGALPEQSAPHD